MTKSTDNPATLTYNVQPEFNGCKGDSFVVTVTVNPTIETDPIDDQILCNGDDTEDVSFSSTNFNDEDSESLVGEFTHTITSQGLQTFNTVVGTQYRLEFSGNGSVAGGSAGGLIDAAFFTSSGAPRDPLCEDSLYLSLIHI